MRLISAVKRLEASAAARAKEVPAGVGLVWSVNEARVDPGDLVEGEYIACDIRMEGGAPGADGAPGPTWWAVSERVTLDARDLGVVSSAGGLRIGRVVELDGSMVTIEVDDVVIG